MNEYDRRQCLRMLEALTDTSANMNGLGRIVANIEFLLSQLQEADVDWAKSVGREWWDLEQMYAFSLSERDGQFGVDEQQAANEIVSRMRQLIKVELGIPDDKP